MKQSLVETDDELTIEDSNRVSGQMFVYLTFSFIGYIDFFGYTGPEILNPFIDF